MPTIEFLLHEYIKNYFIWNNIDNNIIKASIKVFKRNRRGWIKFWPIVHIMSHVLINLIKIRP